MSSQSSAIVVGAAGGIGSATVAALLGRQMHVVGVDKACAPLKHADYMHCQMDFSVPESVDVLVRELGARNCLHVVNVSGGALPAEVDAPAPLELDARAYSQTFDDNVMTSVNSIRLVEKLAAAQPHASRSVTLCSSISVVGDFGYPIYTMNKASIESLVVTEARRLGRMGIRVNCVRLGTVMTARSSELHGASNTEHYKRLLEVSALGRFIAVAEAAAAIVALAVDLSGVTGIALVVDAGQSIPGGHL